MLVRTILIVTLACAAMCEKYTYVPSNLDKVVYIYPENIKKDKDLAICGTGSVCGVVNQRFWLPPHVHRFCQCPKSQCPFTWSVLSSNTFKNDNRSVPLDNRSQVKVCDDVRNFVSCEKNTVGLTMTEIMSSKETKGKREVQILCNCPWPSYWRLNAREANSTLAYSEYICAPLNRCKSGQFCGHMRADTYSTYYQCSCPREHICINTDRTVRNVAELLYTGPMLRAYCMPKSLNQWKGLTRDNNTAGNTIT